MTLPAAISRSAVTTSLLSLSTRGRAPLRSCLARRAPLNTNSKRLGIFSRQSSTVILASSNHCAVPMPACQRGEYTRQIGERPQVAAITRTRRREPAWVMRTGVRIRKIIGAWLLKRKDAPRGYRPHRAHLRAIESPRGRRVRRAPPRADRFSTLPRSHHS